MTDRDKAAEVEAEYLRNIEEQLSKERARALEALEKERDEYPKKTD